MTNRPGSKGAVYPGKRNMAILTGEDDLSTWDEEELIRGQLRNKHGKWPNNPPKIVPKAVHDELVKRKLTKAYDLLNESIYEAVEILIDIAHDEDVDASVRLKAVKEILDRTIGKQPIAVLIEPSKLEKAFNAMLIPEDPPSLAPSGQHGDIVDAEVVDDED